MSQGPPGPQDGITGDGNYVVVPDNGNYAVYSNRKGRKIVGKMPKGEAKRLARDWNKGDKKRKGK